MTLKSGETGGITISYGLSCIVSDSHTDEPAGSSLVLTLRNVASKWIGLRGVTVKNFSLRDANGKEMKIYLRTAPQDMPNDEATVALLLVDKPEAAPQPWTLHFETREPLTPIALTITGIKPPKH